MFLLMSRQLTGVFCIALFGVIGTMAQEKQKANPAYTLKISTDRPDALYQKGKAAVFSVSLLDATDQPVSGRQVDIDIARELAHEHKVVMTTNAPVTFEATLDHPGFILCTVACACEPGRKVTARCGAGFDPLDIKQGRPAPEDFDAFWTKQKTELAAIPMNPRLEPIEVPADSKGKVVSFDVKLDCVGGVPVSGYFSRPAGAAAKSLPAFLSLHASGVRSARRQEGRALKGMLAMDINAHGIENGKPESYYTDLETGRLSGYRTIGADSAEQYYFHGMFLRAVRALEFLKSQPEWDGRTLMVFGSSQGGGQAIAAAGLDPQVSFCAALVPAMCEHTGFLVGQNSGWPSLVKFRDGKPESAAIFKTAGYYDAANFASRIKAETFFNVGLIDVTCPPATVYTAYNNISAVKSIENRPAMGHEYWAEEAEKRMAAYLARARGK